MAKTFAELYYLEEATPWRRLVRNLRLLKFIAWNIWMWATIGRKVRAAYRRSCAEGNPYYVDHLDPERRSQ